MQIFYNRNRSRPCNLISRPENTSGAVDADIRSKVPSSRCRTALLSLRLPALTADIVRSAALPSTEDQADDVIDTLAVLDFGEYCWAAVPDQISTIPKRQPSTIYLIRPASLSMTLRSAPTASARSIYGPRVSKHSNCMPVSVSIELRTLFTTRQSLPVIPGPPFLGTLSPPATSIT